MPVGEHLGGGALKYIGVHMCEQKKSEKGSFLQ